MFERLREENTSLPRWLEVLGLTVLLSCFCIVDCVAIGHSKTRDKTKKRQTG